ncbi:MAG: hypothetical protein ACXVJ7_03285 [Acidimicrobiia bacterium]
MNIKRAISAFAAGGLMLGGLAAFAPSAGATQLNVGGCAGMKGLATFKSTVVGQGLTDSDNQDVTVGVKGVDPNTNGGTNLGTCLFNGGLSTPDGAKPPSKTAIQGTGQSITKWSVKLFSPEADCYTGDTGDNTEWPLNGAFAVTFASLNASGHNNAMSIATSIDGFTDPDNDPNTPSDVVKSHGIVTKGVAAGADSTANVYFDPTVKDKTQTTSSPYFGYSLDALAAAGCTTATQGDANITGAVIGDGTSLFLALPASGLAFTIGQP